MKSCRAPKIPERVLKILSVVGYAGMVAGMVGLLALRAAVSPSPFGVSLQVAAVALLVWARLTFGRRSYHLAANPTEGGLVTWGPYRYIRHPIYSAICLFILVAVVGRWSWQTALWGGLVLGSLLVRIFCEETLVTARYPEYTQYAARTWRIIPLIY